MAGHTPFSKLREQMSPASQAQALETSAIIAAEMNLAEIRSLVKMSQAELAVALKVNQASVSKMEKRTDMLVSTLCQTIAGLGGQLEIIGRFPGRTIRINQFGANGAEVQVDKTV